MIPLKYRILFVLMILGILTQVVDAGPFFAFSLKEAERRCKAAEHPGGEAREMAGISRIAGMVYDSKTGDVIIVGQRCEDDPRVTMDDFVGALRAVLVFDEYPYVSIDRMKDTAETGKLKVNFRGHIENSQFAQDLFEADVVLKKISLGLNPAEIWAVRSYFGMSVDYLRANPAEIEDCIGSRFFFHAKKASLALRDGVAAIRRSVLGVETRVDYAIVNGKSVDDLRRVRDKIGDRFAEQVTINLDDLSVAYPEIARLKGLLALTALAEGMKSLRPKPDLSYWLYEYETQQVRTNQYFDATTRKTEVRTSDNEVLKLQLIGGIELNPMVLRLRAGDVTALREAVLKHRPKENSLTWRVPLEGWCIPGYPELDDSYEYSLKRANQSIGFSLDRQISGAGRYTSQTNHIWNKRLVDQSMHMPKIDIYDNLIPQQFASNVGGVMLDNVAKVGSEQKAHVDLTSGNFSLIAEGESAYLAPETFRKFVTALWAVYFSNQDTGISIDPIAPGVHKHMVRYIGKVINSDLGRVMREADYLTKKWAVGTEKPDIPSFRNPDDISGERGYAYLGSSRIWHVPEDMKFKRADNMLVFEGGKMSVKTEFLLRNSEGIRADSANEQFAQWLTDHYEEIADKYPIYQELFDYAKMVSLAKFLKENGVPLFWFLMANKDLVLTEDSPGTVDALARGSQYFKNLCIEGGVDLGVQGQYVYDSEALKAIHKAISKYQTNSNSHKPVSYKVNAASLVPGRFSFDLGKRSYCVVPQHSLTSGKDRRGIRYQTDIALRDAGFRLTKESWSALRSEIIYREFAKEWNRSIQTLSQQELETEGERLYKQAWKEADKKVADTVEKLRELIGQEHKNENEFAKVLEAAVGRAQANRLKPLALKHAYYMSSLELVRYFNPRQQRYSEFGKNWRLLVPYRVRPAGKEKREFLNAILPEQMVLENLITGEQEVLTFGKNRYSIAGYVPDKLDSSQVVGLFIMSDASYRLADKLGNEFWFDQVGRLTDMLFSQDHHIHLEYLHTFTQTFEQSLYKIEPVGNEQIRFLNALVPKIMRIEDLVNGTGEVLVFSDKGVIAGYVPKDEERSRFEILALMSDTSFRLLDKRGNEVVFRPDGQFESLEVSPDDSLVESISAGPYRICFRYTAVSSGRLLLSSARLLEEGKTTPLYTVHYEYDNQGRLCSAKGSGTKIAQFDKGENEVLPAQLFHHL